MIIVQHPWRFLKFSVQTDGTTVKKPGQVLDKDPSLEGSVSTLRAGTGTIKRRASVRIVSVRISRESLTGMWISVMTLNKFQKAL